MTAGPFELLLESLRPVLATHPEIEVVESAIGNTPRLVLTRTLSDGVGRYMRFSRTDGLIPGLHPLFAVLFGEFGHANHPENYDGRQIADIAYATTLARLFVVEWTTSRFPDSPFVKR